NYFVESDEEFEYVIRFQNTGTDTAFTVLISDTLDMNLQWESLQPIDASHLYQAQLDLDAGVVEFLFENIMLPDSNVNEAASHGHVIYRIRPKANLADSTRIENTAAIYFDANPPVITNTVFSTFSKCGLLDPDTDIVYFPGPTVLEVDICAGEMFEWMDQVLDTTGIYTILLQTTEGCDSLIELHLTVHELPMLEDVIIQDANSNGGGSVQPILAGGTPPYTYLWSNGSTEAILENVAAGNYALLVTDAIGCSISLGFEVPLNTGTRFPEAPILSISPNPVKAGASLFVQNPASSDEMSFLLYDAFGQSHAVEVLQTAADRVELKAPSKAGVYWLVAQNLDKQWVQRILVY
ncbi:MAG: hypothetical protein KDC44_14880, partial [Phaeodactylibacter sp.]|nr:hypothetical protein [Phaeodactylibacter sp.]